MKYNIFGFSLMVVCLVIFTSCEKNESTVDFANFESDQDISTAQNLIEDIEDQEALGMDEFDDLTKGGGPLPDCAELTWLNDKGTYPNMLTIDFGIDGCTGINDRVRKGQIIIDISAPLKEAGAVKTVSLVNFSIDDVQITGSKTATNNGKDDSAHRSFTRTVDIQLLFPDATSVTWQASHTVTQLGGLDTPIRADDVVEIAGYSSGSNRNGASYHAEITLPLVKERTCPWIVSGERFLEVNDNVRTINYGLGTCDPFATALNDNGDTKQILLRKWWK